MKEYKKLSLRDRCLIKIGIDNRQKTLIIAKNIGRNRSVVSREIKKNGGRLWYDPIKAQERSMMTSKKGYSKIEEDNVLKDFIVSKIKIDWSPVVIAGRWNLGSSGSKISHETIYSWIYSENMRGEKLFEYLPRHKKKRGIAVRKSAVHDSKKRSIKDRPEIVENRSRIGDWEGDLVFQQGNQSANMLTLIERKTRFVAIQKHDSKKAEPITLSIKKFEQQYGMKTLTLDNGSEFSRYADYATDTYFCNPGSPWQKGSIEHLNGMVRRRLDYRIPLSEVSQSTLDKIAEDLNNMPRKILNFMTPNEAYLSSRMKLAQPAMEALQ